MNLSTAIHDFILSLVDKHQKIHEIWFIGSRANNARARPDSDWDFLIFAEPSVYKALKYDDEFRERAISLNIDLLVESEKDAFESPWHKKRLTKKDLQWQKLSLCRAKYLAVKRKDFDPWEQHFLSEWEEYALERGADLSEYVPRWQNGLRIWPIK